MMFGRKKKHTSRHASGTDRSAESVAPDTPTAEEPQGAPETAAAEARGPRDRSDVESIAALVDLGSVHVRPAAGMELRLEVDNSTQEVSALQMGNDDGAVQVQVFAAPRSSGIWDEIRGEIAQSITANGGTVEEATGAFGPELRTRLAQPGPQGRTVFAPAVFAGVDGPRWFLRAVYSGAPAVDEAARGAFDESIRSIVVTRGEEPRAPREPLPLTVPAAARKAGTDEAAAPDDASAADEAEGDDLKPFERGPEITEVR